MLIPDLVIKAADQSPDKIGLIHNDAILTYEEIYEKSLRLSHTLKHMGVEKSDRICFYMEKRLEKVVSIFGIALSGGVMVPIRRLARPHQVTHIVNNCGAKVLITTSSRIPALLKNTKEMPTLKAIISIGEYGETSTSDKIDLIYWKDLMKNGPMPPQDNCVSEHDPAAILYTSGSTGRPKGVILTHLNIVSGAKKVSKYLRISSDDRLLSILTFGFDYGFNQLMTSFLHCAQLVLLDYLFPRDIISAVDRYSITGLAAVSATWLQLLQMPWKDAAMKNLRYITNSGGSIPSECVYELRRRLPDTDIYLMYGLTEAFRSTYLDPSLIDKYPTSIGKAVPGEEVMILDEDDQPVKPGQIGELVHRGVLVSQGYWNDPELTAQRFRRNPLQHKDIPIPETVVYSGDYVKSDEDGFLYFIGRKDEMIKCAGNRISPTEVEEIIHGSGIVSDVVAFGIPHEIYDQVVIAVVSPLQDVEVDARELMKYCRNTMPPYMVPEKIEIWERLPCNQNGKLDRAAIKKEVYTKHRKLDTDEHRLSGF